MSSIQTGIIPTLLIGKRDNTRKVRATSLAAGNLIRGSYTHVRFVTPIIQSAKIVNPTTDVHIAPLEQGTFQEKIFKGMSTYGIGYTPTITETTQQHVRRWPRDWHGDNIKN